LLLQSRGCRSLLLPFALLLDERLVLFEKLI